MESKTRRAVNIAAIAVPSLMVAFSGVMKLVANPQTIETLSRYGVSDHLTILGIMELLFAGLFAYPNTMKLGFILLSCYFSGAIAAEWSHQALTVKPFIPLVVIWIGAFVKDRSIFLPKSKFGQYASEEGA